MRNKSPKATPAKSAKAKAYGLKLRKAALKQAKPWAGGFNTPGMSLDEIRDEIAVNGVPMWWDGITLHNTGVPDIDRAMQIGVEKYVHNIAGWYKAKWSAAPHGFVGIDKGAKEPIIVKGTPWDKRGVHSPSFNGSKLGFEMVANFAPGDDDDDAGPGLLVKDAMAKLFAALFYARGIPANNSTLKFHKEDPRTDHDCPGRDVEKADFLYRVQTYLADHAPAGDHDPSTDTTAPPPKPVKIGDGIVNTPDLNLRSTSGMAGIVIAVLAKGTKVEIFGKAQNGVTTWLKVKVASSGKEGWVSGRYVTPDDGKPVAHPLTPPQEMLDLLKTQSFPFPGAFGLIGNGMVESYPDLQTGVVGDAGLAHGMFQWQDSRDPNRNTRFDQLVRFSSELGKPWTDRPTQLLFALHELKTTERHAGELFQSATTIDQAVDAGIAYLRPSIPHRDVRRKYAVELEKWWKENRT
jgi:hypothetical protein